jgi:hypothetical protein
MIYRCPQYCILFAVALTVGACQQTGTPEAQPSPATKPSRRTAVGPSGFLGVPFGASLKEVDEAIMQRPGVRRLKKYNKPKAKWIRYGDPNYHDYPVRYTLCSSTSGFYFAEVWFNSFTASGEEVADQFVAVSNLLSDEYGKPDAGRGELTPASVADPSTRIALRWMFPAENGQAEARVINLEVRYIENAQNEHVSCLHLYFLDNTRLPEELAPAAQPDGK